MLSRRGASFQKGRFSFAKRLFLFRYLVIFRKKIKRFLVRRLKVIILPDRVRKYQTQNSAFFLHRLRFVKYSGPFADTITAVFAGYDRVIQMLSRLSQSLGNKPRPRET